MKLIKIVLAFTTVALISGVVAKDIGKDIRLDLKNSKIIASVPALGPDDRLIPGKTSETSFDAKGPITIENDECYFNADEISPWAGIGKRIIACTSGKSFINIGTVKPAPQGSQPVYKNYLGLFVDAQGNSLIFCKSDPCKRTSAGN